MGVAINRLVSYVEKGVMPLNPVYIPPLTCTTISYYFGPRSTLWSTL